MDRESSIVVDILAKDNNATHYDRKTLRVIGQY